MSFDPNVFERLRRLAERRKPGEVTCLLGRELLMICNEIARLQQLWRSVPDYREEWRDVPVEPIAEGTTTVGEIINTTYVPGEVVDAVSTGDADRLPDEGHDFASCNKLGCGKCADIYESKREPNLSQETRPFVSHHVDCCIKGCDGNCYPKKP